MKRINVRNISYGIIKMMPWFLLVLAIPVILHTIPPQWLNELWDDFMMPPRIKPLRKEGKQHGIKITYTDAYSRDYQEGLDWFYDYGYDFIGFVDYDKDPPQYGATPRKRNGLYPRDFWYKGHCTQSLIFYEESFSCNNGEYLFRLVNGKFKEEFNVDNLGDILHIFNFEDLDDLLSDANRAKIAQIKPFIKDEPPRYAVYFDNKDVHSLGNIYEIARHPHKTHHYIFSSSSSHQRAIEWGRNTKLSRAKTYYRYDAQEQELYLMREKEVAPMDLTFY